MWWDDLGEYIVNECNKNSINSMGNNNDNNTVNNGNFSCKVVEIAIGKFFFVGDYLKNFSAINFTATDIVTANLDVVFDDILKPNMEIYDNSDIIYSIRPPQELQPYIANIVSKTGAILIIKPLFNENLSLDLHMKLVNYKKAVFYQSNI